MRSIINGVPFRTITWQDHAWFRSEESVATTWPSGGVVFQYFAFLSRVCEMRRLTGRFEGGGISSPSLPPSFHSSDSPSHPRFPSTPAGVYRTLKEGATGPRRGTHIHAPGKHKHHACFRRVIHDGIRHRHRRPNRSVRNHRKVREPAWESRH